MLEDQHHLDIVMDTARPHQDWVLSILSLYRSTIIYSNGLYKIISDRADLPLRQVFHAGNTIPGRTVLQMGGHPLKPNQINVTYADQNLRYNQTTKFAQDSVSIYSNNEPIRAIDLSLRGISRETEALRQASLFLQRNTQIKRDVTWATAMEGLAVEPGDRCKVGMLMTDYEAGYGGRALDGAVNRVDLDRTVEIVSGKSYDLYVWHTATDTVEERAVSNSPGIYFSILPGVNFTAAPQAGDRWALGVTSEDLIDVRVTRYRREPSGVHVLTGEEFLPISFKLDCTGSVTTVSTNLPPSQPRSATATVSNCILCANVVAAPSSEGGILTRPGCFSSAYLSIQHNPNSNSLFMDQIRFASGPASGQGSIVTLWGAASRWISWAPAVDTAANSGDSYYITGRDNSLAGVMIEIQAASGQPFVPHATFAGNSGCVDITDTGADIQARLVPFSDRGLFNSVGPWVFSLAAPGCANLDLITKVTTITGSAQQTLYGVIFPGSALGLRNKLEGEIGIFLTECCSAADESTELAFHLEFGGQTLVPSLLIILNNPTSLATITGSGEQAAALLEFSIQNLGSTSKQSATLKYSGPTNSGYAESVKTGTGSVGTTINQSLGISAAFRHFDGGVHSHNCFNLVPNYATLTVTNIDSGEV